MECPNCHAALDIDIEHMQAYCPYCGTKLLFDLDQLNQIFAEKEKTKRLQIEKETEVSKAKIQAIIDILNTDTGRGLAFFLCIALVMLSLWIMIR